MPPPRTPRGRLQDGLVAAARRVRGSAMRTFLRRLGAFFLFLLVALCFAPTIVPPFLDRVYYQGPVRDHYDGRHFFNPDSPTPQRIDPRRFLNRWVNGER